MDVIELDIKMITYYKIPQEQKIKAKDKVNCRNQTEQLVEKEESKCPAQDAKQS